MADGSKIEWTEATWNPIRGCSRVSEGCRHCYAETVAARFSGPGLPYEGLARRVGGEARWTNEVRFVEKHLTDPLRWRRPRKIFVNSMSDLFHEQVPDEWIDRVFAVMAQASQHTFQVLTKRPERMRDYLIDLGENRARAMTEPQRIPYSVDELPSPSWPLSNVWLGISAEDQATADERVPLLLNTPAAVRFVSAEPLLGPIDFEYVDQGIKALSSSIGPNLDWIIVGGESGPNARPMHPDWARSIRDQCQAAGTTFFFKQWGAWLPWLLFADAAVVDDDETQSRFKTVIWDGVTPSEGKFADLGNGFWADVNDTWGGGARGPDDADQIMGCVGKAAAGRLLDGRTWDEFPEARP